MSPPVPISQYGRRLPTAGRLRAGRKGGKGQPEKLSTWRATSHDREAVEQIAAIYGGTVHEWSDKTVAAGQYEVITDAREIRIVLPPDPLGDSPIYELWSGGGCQRRCDGVACATTVQGPDGGEPGEVDCICAHKGVMECTVKTRLSVVLPDVRFAGVWRIDTGSEHAAHELPGMVDMIATLIGSGQLPYAILGLEQRQKPGKKFAVPVLRLPTTLEGLMAGRGQAGALAARPANGGELEAGAPHDDEVVDAELVEPRPAIGEQVDRLMGLYDGLADDRKAACVRWLETKFGVEEFDELSQRQAAEAIAGMEAAAKA